MLATSSPLIVPGILGDYPSDSRIVLGGNHPKHAANPKNKGNTERPHRSTERNRVLMLGSIRELALYRAEVLQQHGFHVQIATNRDQGLDLIQAGNYDVVVVSYTLPDTVVREFADEMRDYCPKCPVIAISNAHRPDPIIRPDQMILGDEGPAALLSALRHVLRRH
jgi:CheY-like chemotaxis protein